MFAISRRGALAGLATALAMAPSRVRARTRTIGKLRVTTLSDGHMSVGLDRILPGDPTSADVMRAMQAFKLDAGQQRFALNVTLIEMDGRRILVDVGAGGTWVDTAGKLADNLSAAGIDPSAIDLVVFTHAHPDHLWGAIDDFDDSVRFTKARYAIPDAEFRFWMSSTAPEAAGVGEGMIAGTRRILRRLEDKLQRIPGDTEIVPGLAYVTAPGHTPGHCAVLADGSGALLLITGDVFFHPVVSIAHPDITPAQDMDGAMATRSRRKLIDLARSTAAAVAAYHIAEPGLGLIQTVDGTTSWQPYA